MIDWSTLISGACFGAAAALLATQRCVSKAYRNGYKVGMYDGVRGTVPPKPVHVCTSKPGDEIVPPWRH